MVPHEATLEQSISLIIWEIPDFCSYTWNSFCFKDNIWQTWCSMSIRWFALSQLFLWVIRRTRIQ